MASCSTSSESAPCGSPVAVEQHVEGVLVAAPIALDEILVVEVGEWPV
jgi:hypothetical protein